jgi:hypothetical protein
MAPDNTDKVDMPALLAQMEERGSRTSGLRIIFRVLSQSL